MGQPRLPDVHVRLVGEDGNAFAILGRTEQAMKRAGHGDLVEEFHAEATSDDYNKLLNTVMAWVRTDEDEEDNLDNMFVRVDDEEEE